MCVFLSFFLFLIDVTPKTKQNYKIFIFLLFRFVPLYGRSRMTSKAVQDGARVPPSPPPEDFDGQHTMRIEARDEKSGFKLDAPVSVTPPVNESHLSECESSSDHSSDNSGGKATDTLLDASVAEAGPDVIAVVDEVIPDTGDDFTSAPETQRGESVLATGGDDAKVCSPAKMSCVVFSSDRCISSHISTETCHHMHWMYLYFSSSCWVWRNEGGAPQPGFDREPQILYDKELSGDRQVAWTTYQSTLNDNVNNKGYAQSHDHFMGLQTPQGTL